MTWNVEKTKIAMSNGAVVDFDFEISQVMQVDNVLVVILEVPPDRVMPENVFGVSPTGALLWRIERTVENSSDPTNRYIEITGHANGVVRIYNWNGVNSGVDVHTGKVLDARIAK